MWASAALVAASMELQRLLIARCMGVHVFEVLGLCGAAQYLKPSGKVLN